MIPYICTYLGSCFFAVPYSIAKDLSVRVLSGIMLFSFLFLPLALRYGIGTDYANYTSIIETGIRHNYIPGFEIGWFPIITLIKQFNLSLQFFFIVPAFFTVLIFMTVVPRDKILFCLPVFFCFSWINSFNIVRQAFSSMFFLLSLDAYKKNRISRTIVWGIIACCFHKSAILCSLLLLLVRYIKTPKYIYRNVFIFIIVILLFFIGKLGNRLFSVVAGYTPYAVYLNSAFADEAKLGSGLGVWLKEILLLLLLFSTKETHNESFNKENNLVRVFCFVMGIAIILSAQIRILGRIASLFDSIYIFLIIHLSMSSVRLRKIYLLFIFFVTSVLFFKTISGSPSSARSGLGVYPYQSVLSR